MDDLSDRLFRLMTPEMKADVENSFKRDMTIQSKSLRRVPPDPMAEKNIPVPNMKDLEESDLLDPAVLQETLVQSLLHMKPRFPPLEKLPCANVQAEKYTACENRGNLACSACKLVSYCSKVRAYLPS